MQHAIGQLSLRPEYSRNIANVVADDALPLCITKPSVTIMQTIQSEVLPIFN